jgi:hypothetical protein
LKRRCHPAPASEERESKVDFDEMPDLTATTRQAARFWAVDERIATAALQHVEERGILRQARLGFRRSW